MQGTHQKQGLKTTVAIVGGGSAALMLASVLDPDRFSVSIYERNAAPGRKFLVAGDGGFNLTHSESPELFISRYTPSGFLKEAFTHFSNHDLISWLAGIGIDTYTGSSGRVFPRKGIKPVDVLNAFLKQLEERKVQIFTRRLWTGFDAEGALCFENGEKVKSDLTVFCLGGASWPVTGSHGDWGRYFETHRITVKPWEASNCSFRVDWPKGLPGKAEGKALKNLSLRCGEHPVKGEIVMTAFGLEGSGIYPLSPQIRAGLHRDGYTTLFMDLKPEISVSLIEERIRKRPGKRSYTEEITVALNLSDAQLQLLKHALSKKEFLDAALLAKNIKALKVAVNGTGPVEEAISTVGGIALSEINSEFELKKLPRHFVIGEMLDYDAPTGGYLLQSCFSMGKWLGDFLNKKHVVVKMRG